ncbi:major facilitator superfamily domain-containing protein [Aspergillus karnatakaensis]|uniref:major facilitator superfamily domain-containing protein n=1 Tax=Aspergillus karnatakaensis TaxID=1810916 RepID=UPI003CCD2033
MAVHEGALSGPNTTTDQEEDSVSSSTSLWTLIPVTLALCSTLFCVSLDAAILATTIPKITTYFNAPDDIAWYGSSYTFATCAVQLVFGKLYQFHPSKPVFLSSLLVFEVGSLLCGVVTTSDMLIVGRTIAGLGATGLFSGCLIIIAKAVPLRVRPAHMGLVSSMHAVASVAGPIMGGALTDHLSWRWCFYINLPFGGLAVLFLLVFLPMNIPPMPDFSWPDKVKQFDLPGLMFLIPSIICLIFALQWGGVQWPWADGRIIALFTVSGATFMIFVAIQVHQGDRATIPLRLLKNLDIWGAVWYGVCLSAAMFIFTYYVSTPALLLPPLPWSTKPKQPNLTPRSYQSTSKPSNTQPFAG